MGSLSDQGKGIFYIWKTLANEERNQGNEEKCCESDIIWGERRNSDGVCLRY